jgi:hypothetical protein
MEKTHLLIFKCSLSEALNRLRDGRTCDAFPEDQIGRDKWEEVSDICSPCRR